MTRKQTEHDTTIYRQARAELLRDQPHLPLVSSQHSHRARSPSSETDQGGTLDDGYVASHANHATLRAEQPTKTEN
jgi:hypothetical protein